MDPSQKDRIIRTKARRVTAPTFMRRLYSSWPQITPVRMMPTVATKEPAKVFQKTAISWMKVAEMISR